MTARHEYKHSLNYMDYTILRSRLKAVMNRDENVDANGEYRVRSLYFDTPDDRALLDKINGVNRREKFRIRRYSGDTELVRLEKKSKVSGLCYKRTETITAGELCALLAGDTDWMLADDRPLAAELYSKMRGQMLRPKTIVDYIREPFVCKAGNVRVTLDREIRTGLYSTDFFNGRLPTVAAGDELVLLEVKYDAFIPQIIVDALRLPGRRATECSKYALCRMYG